MHTHRIHEWWVIRARVLLSHGAEAESSKLPAPVGRHVYALPTTARQQVGARWNWDGEDMYCTVRWKGIEVVSPQGSMSRAKPDHAWTMDAL